MRKNVQFFTAAILASTILISTLPASFALGDTEFSSSKANKNQSYTPSYPQNNNNYSQDSAQDYDQNSGYNTSYNPNSGGGYGNGNGYSNGGYGNSAYGDGGNYRNSGYGGGNYGNSGGGYGRPLQGHVVTVPVGTEFTASPSSQISTDNVTVGDTVTMQLGSDLAYNGVVAVPAGSTVEGNVVIADKEGMTQKYGRLKIDFTDAILPNGRRVPLKAQIKTDDGSGILIGETNLNRGEGVAKDAAAGAIGGALFGTALGAITHNVGRGAIYGTAIGGGLGLGKAALDKGNGVTIPAGAPVNIVLKAPLSAGGGAPSHNTYNQPSSNYNY